MVGEGDRPVEPGSRPLLPEGAQERYRASRGMAMIKVVKLCPGGGTVSATPPKDMAERLHLAAGDRVLAIETVLATPLEL
jgi:hypothetical protein